MTVIETPRQGGQVADCERAMRNVLADNWAGYGRGPMRCDHEHAEALQEAAIALIMGGRARGGSPVQMLAGDMAAAGLGELGGKFAIDASEAIGVLGDVAMSLIQEAAARIDPAWIICDVPEHA